MTKTLTCIICPNGCELEIDLNESGGIDAIRGATCKRGEAYARQEMLSPMRTIASSVRLVGGTMPLVSVRLDRPIPKERIFDAMEVIRHVTLEAPVRIGDIAVENILGLESNLIVTKHVDRA